jgi:hypothetical protein
MLSEDGICEFYMTTKHKRPNIQAKLLTVEFSNIYLVTNALISFSSKIILNKPLAFHSLNPIQPQLKNACAHKLRAVIKEMQSLTSSVL